MESFSATARVIPRCNIVESYRLNGWIIQPVVEKAERALLVCDQIVIKLGEYGRRGLFIGDQPGARG